MSVDTNMEIYKEDTKEIKLTLTKPDADAWSDYKAIMTVSDRSTSEIKFAITETFGAAEQTLSILKTHSELMDIKEYNYDIRVYKADLSIIKTVRKAVFKLKNRISDL